MFIQSIYICKNNKSIFLIIKINLYFNYFVFHLHKIPDDLVDGIIVHLICERKKT